jgi:hypothetical protein
VEIFSEAVFSFSFLLKDYSYNMTLQYSSPMSPPAVAYSSMVFFRSAFSNSSGRGERARVE